PGIEHCGCTLLFSAAEEVRQARVTAKMRCFWKKVAWYCAAFTGLLGCFPFSASSQQYSKSDREFAHAMLRDVSADVQKYYYDAKLHGVDWDARVRQAKENIDKADSLNGAVAEIAAALDSLNDSHTFFIPPPRTFDLDYGFKMEMIGDHCYVIRVHSGSDAEKKGLKPGDEIVAVDEHPLSRRTLWRIHYIYDTLSPQPGLRLTLRNDAGQERQLEVLAKFKTSSDVKYFLHQGVNVMVQDMDKKRLLLRARYFEKGDGFLAVKIPEFGFSAEEVDNIIGKMRKHKCVVLDLRGNPGGFTDTLDRLLGGLFQNDVKTFDRVQRSASKPVTATGRHHDAFIGRFIVLIDSESASASELFARVVQLERRGFLIGDHSAGKVMEAKRYRHAVGVDMGIFYAASVTVADLLMADGKSLEHVGVEPDIEILPTAHDLANACDPAMAKAAGLLGVQLSPQEAATMFPYEDPTGN
ncbi:MAG TPA: S41 family peptidase, partial [Terriglobales bacterium]|nr:S41 family peptidase [Terriglobales bacterium]